MEDHGTPRDILDDLKVLSKAGRQRYMSKLPPGMLCESYCLLLEDMDNQPTVRSSATALGQGSEAPSKQTPKVSMSDDLAAASNGRRLKRRHFSHAPVIQNEVEDGQENLTEQLDSRSLSTENVMPERRTSTRIKTSPLTYSEYLLEKDFSQQLEVAETTVHHSIDAPGLPFCLLLPGINGKDALQDIEFLPADVRSVLKSRFRDTYSKSISRAANFRRLCKNPQLRLDNAVCLRHYLMSNTVRALANPTGCFSRGGAARKSADNTCIKLRIPCAYVFQNNEEFVICFVPLPEKLRVGKAWTELGFWVEPGDYTSNAGYERKYRIWEAYGRRNHVSSHEYCMFMGMKDKVGRSAFQNCTLKPRSSLAGIPIMTIDLQKRISR